MTSDFVARLRQEIPQWRADGLIDEDQAAALLARYADAARRAPNRLALVLTFLGALSIGVGVILFLAANWPSVPGWSKLALVLSGIAGAYTSGYWLRFGSARYPGTGNALLFLGALLYGAGIFLVAQGYHVNAEAPSLLVLWTAGLLPMAYLLASRPLVTLALLTLGIALVYEATFWTSEFMSPSAFLAVTMLYGTLLYALGGLHRDGFRQSYGMLGLFVLLGSLIPLTFASVEVETAKVTLNALPPGGQVRFVVLWLAAAAATALFTWRARADRAVGGEGAALALTLLVAGGSLFTPMPAIFTNVLLLGLCVGAIGVGYERREPAWVNLGLLFFGVAVACRYTEFLWGNIPGESFFVGAGAILLGGGFALERTRRRLLGDFEKKVSS